MTSAAPRRERRVAGAIVNVVAVVRTAGDNEFGVGRVTARGFGKRNDEANRQVKGVKD